MNNTWSFVDENGVVTGARFTGPKHALADNTPAGCRAVEGVLERPSDEDYRRRERALTLIAELERRQSRPLRELQLDPSNVEATARLRGIEREIEQLRASV